MNVRVFGWIAAIGLMSWLTIGSTDATVSYAQQTAAPTTEAKDTAVPKPAADAEQPVTPEKPEKPEKQTTGEPAKGEHAGGEHAAGDHAAGGHAAGGHAAGGHAAGGHAAGGHGHHDPTDLSHANDGPGHTNAFPKALTGLQEIKADLAIYTFVVFLLLLGILLKFGWGPIMAGLDKREKSMRDLSATSERNARESE